MKLPINYTRIGARERREVREEYIRIQDGKCWWCENALTDNPTTEIMDTDVNRRLFPPNFFKHPVHLQHDHDTGMTEGAVHARCNAVMWQYHGK